MVIDASVAFKLIFDEPGTSAATGWASRVEFVAPVLLHAEVANAIWKRVHRGEIGSGASVPQQLQKLGRVVRTIEEVPYMPRAVELAIELDHPVYDCVYLALAEAEGDRLLTADRRFVKAVAGTPYAERVEELGV